MKKTLAVFLAALMTLFPVLAFAATPTVMDTIPSAALCHQADTGTSISFTYTVPAGGQNKMLVVPVSDNVGAFNGIVTALSLNGVDFKANFVTNDGSLLSGMTVWYLPAPTSGTFTLTWTGSHTITTCPFTLQDVAQTSPVDVHGENSISSTADTTSVTTTVGNDFLVALAVHTPSTATVVSYGAGQSEIATTTTSAGTTNWIIAVSGKPAGSTNTSESMTTTFSNSAAIDQMVAAFKYQAPTVATTKASKPLSRAFWWGL